jgi:hypothetical protein
MKNFLAVSEKGRVRGKITFYIGEVMPDTQLRLIDDSLQLKPRNHKGFETEIVNLLVAKGELPKDCITDEGYVNYDPYLYGTYQIIMVEGAGINGIRIF